MMLNHHYFYARGCIGQDNHCTRIENQIIWSYTRIIAMPPKPIETHWEEILEQTKININDLNRSK